MLNSGKFFPEKRNSARFRIDASWTLRAHGSMFFRRLGGALLTGV